MNENSVPTLESYLALISPAHRGKPRFMALCAAVLSQAADLIRLYQVLPEAFDLNRASGTQLDAMGQLAGISRPGANVSDADYRAYLRAWIQLHHWDGSNAALPALLSAAFPDQEARLRDNGDGTATASLPGGFPFPPGDVFPRPAGIRLLENQS